MTATAAPRAGSPDPVARRATDQVDPYALIERAEGLLGSDPHDAVVFALRAQAVARARTAEALMARSHFVAGAALMQVGDWTDAMRQLSQAQRFYTAQKDFGAQCKVLTQLAVACCELGEYSEALDGFGQALALAREHGENAAARRVLVHQSTVYTALGDFGAARASLRSALELPSGSTADEGVVIMQFGQVDASEGLRAAMAGNAATVATRMADAAEHFEVALELLEATSDRADAIAARILLGSARCWLGRFKEGLDDLTAAAGDAARAGFTLREVQARLELGYHLVAEGRDQEGMATLLPAMRRAEELGDLRRPADAHERLSALYEGRADYKPALMHHKRFVEVKSKLDGRLSEQRARLYEARKELQRLRSQTEGLHQRARDLEQSRSSLERLALEDELTGLANRRAFTREFEQWCAQARAGALRFGLVATDVDEFKQINDQHSHLTGDAVLRQLGQLIRANLRDTDFAARMGGDEFALLISDSEQGAAVAVVERLLGVVRGWNWSEFGDGLAVTLSIGLCESTDFDDSNELIQRADEALYASKRTGRDRYSVWEGDHA
jgi:diguanylate cyclase (GGDEF)-like protein